ncbi:MAG: hypothetical protein FJY82_06290 [Candidatus Aminicenantes bacterium]|nr:hypothetical protein [Candidatus Aminicenantes bacterium]
MKFDWLLRIVGNEPVFNSSLLLSGDIDPADLGRQLSRWTRAGRLLQLRRGLYALAGPFQKTPAHPFLVANGLKKGSYVSLESALEYHGLIPEHTPNVVSVTTGRPETLATPLGTYLFRHVKRELFFGYERIDLGEGQSAWIATPEKALLDLVYLTPLESGRAEVSFLEELRLQNVAALSRSRLRAVSLRADSPKLRRAVRRLESLFGKDFCP